MGKGRKEVKLGLSQAYDIFWAFDRHKLYDLKEIISTLIFTKLKKYHMFGIQHYYHY